MKKTVGAVILGLMFAVAPAQAQLPFGSSLVEPVAPAPAANVQAAPAFDPLLKQRLDAATANVLARHQGFAAIAVDDGQHTYFSGNVDTGHVMSTMKVPMALAAERMGVANPDDVSAALRWSDNAAADRMWEALGGGDAAVARVQEQLAMSGTELDTTPGTYWSLPLWSVTDQANFARTLQCQDPDFSVLGHMSEISPEQRYGLGRIPGAMMKGGWSPMNDGRYFVRQFALIHTAQGSVGVSLAAQSAEGSHGSAQAMLDELAAEIDHSINLGLGTPLTC